MTSVRDLKEGTLYIIGVSMIVGTLLLAIAGSYWVALAVSQRGDHRWCTTLALLTAQKVQRPEHPEQDVSRQRAYIFYVHLTNLERQFGCD
jgi:hypothetical protein